MSVEQQEEEQGWQDWEDLEQELEEFPPFVRLTPPEGDTERTWVCGGKTNRIPSLCGERILLPQVFCSRCGAGRFRRLSLEDEESDAW